MKQNSRNIQYYSVQTAALFLSGKWSIVDNTRIYCIHQSTNNLDSAENNFLPKRKEDGRDTRGQRNF